MNYDDLPTSKEKKARIKELHAKRPSLGAVNDRRKITQTGSVEAEIEDEELIARINARLEKCETVTIEKLASKYDLEPKKLRAIIRKLGYNAPSVNGVKKYAWDSQSFELYQIEEKLKSSL